MAREHIKVGRRHAQRLEALTSLAGGLAHQFNELLTSVIGYAEIAHEEAGDNRTLREAIEHIIVAGQRASTLTHQLMAFGRQGKRQPTTLDLNQCIATLHTVLQHVFRSDIRIVTNQEARLELVVADRAQMEEAITHLVANACEAVPSGGTVTLETRNVEMTPEGGAADSYVMVAVSDNGPGMDEESCARIFEPCFGTRPGGRTGLALAAVHGIVEQNGGTIAVESELSRGTTFRIYLPRAAALAQAAPALGDQAPTLVQASPAQASTASNPNCAVAHEVLPVLLVDDDASVRRLTAEILRRQNYKVFEACDGASALSLLKNNKLKVDLLITDLNMPGMSGYEVGQRVQQISPTTRVLFISGYAVATQFMNAGFGTVNLLLKPFTVRDFLQKIDEVLGASFTAEAESA